MPDSDDQIPAVDVFAILRLNENDEHPVVAFEHISPLAEPFSLQAIVNFARPRGWFVQAQPTQAEFFYQIFTTELGVRRYGYFLTTWAETENSSLYSAITIVIISNFFHPMVFKELLLELNLLSREDSKSQTKTIEKSISTLLCTTVSINSLKDVCLASSRVNQYDGATTAMANTCTDVHDLFQHLGMQTTLKLVQAILSDAKIVLTSRSHLRLSKAQSAILSLIQPFFYIQTCITILPESLYEILHAPTPFLIGVLSDFELEASEEYILVEIDNGSASFPDHVSILYPEKIFIDRLYRRIENVLFPGSEEEDFAISRNRKKSISIESKDKRLRACFLLYFAEIIYGYQYFILYNKRNVSETSSGVSAVSFHSSAFMGFRNLKDEFVIHMLKSEYFNAFISSRANFTRKPDAFDKIQNVNNDAFLFAFDETIQIFNQIDLGRYILSKKYVNDYQEENLDKIVSNLSEENAFSSFSIAGEESHSKLRKIDIDKIEIDTLMKSRYSRQMNGIGTQILPVPDISALLNYHQQRNEYHAHRNQVLTNFMDNLLEKGVNPSKKVLKAVQLSMRYPCLRVHFCQLLEKYSTNNSILETSQFDVLSQLVNVVLENESVMDELGVVYRIMHLSFTYCRKLHRSVYQYLYTMIQDHKVWHELAFWNNCFYYDVHMASFASTSSSNLKDPSIWRLIRVPCILEVLAKESHIKSPADEHEENDIILAQTKHYINLMIGLQVPLDIYSFKPENDTTLTLTRESPEKVDESERNEFAVNQLDEIATRITKTLDYILSLTGRKNEIRKSSISEYIEMHTEGLQDVSAETMTLSALMNTGLDVVFVNNNEHLVIDPLKCYLLSNYHEVPLMDEENWCCSLPAKGTIYVTNYRLVFKGKAINPTLSEEVVVYTIPLQAIDVMKKASFKKVNEQMKHIDDIHGAIVVTSKVCHAMKIVFDSQTTVTMIEKLLASVSEMRKKSFAYISVRNKIDALPSRDDVKTGILTPLRRFEGITKKRSESWKFRDFSINKGSFSPSLDICEVDMSATRGPDVHRHYASVDYPRLGFLTAHSLFRVTYANSEYKLCSSYPSALIVPADVSDTSLAKISKNFVDNRFPAVVWQNKHGAFIARGSGLVNRTVVKKLKKAVTHGRSSSNTLKAMSLIHGGSQQTIYSKASSGDDSASTAGGVNLKSNDAQNFYLSALAMSSTVSGEDRIFRCDSMESISTISGPRVFTDDFEGCDVDSITSQPENDDRNSGFKRFAAARSSLNFKPEQQKSILEVVKTMKRSPMYLFLEKHSHVKIRSDNEYQVLNLKSIKTSKMEKSFEKLVELLRLDREDVTADHSHGFYTKWGETEWPDMITNLLKIANAIASLVELNNSSMVFCLDNDKSYTAQLSSLTQLLLDPFYRTIQGFQVLVEKEWLAFGYDFEQSDNELGGTAFILFLDCVHQVLKQIPSAFEFSPFYIRFLAYHSTSGFYRTFLESCEQTRINLEVVAPESVDDFGCVIWHYIKNKVTTSSIFSNPFYVPNELVLTPSSSLCRVEIWELFTEENLYHGSPYDLESAKKELVNNIQMHDENEQRFINNNLIARELNDDQFANLVEKVGKTRQNFVTQWNQRKENIFELVSSDDGTDYLNYGVQKRNALNVFKNTLACFENNEKDASKEENKQKKEHHVTTYHAGMIPAKCGKCLSIITRWSKAIECKKCHFQFHTSCVGREFTTNDILHVNNLKMEEEVLEIPEAAIMNESIIVPPSPGDRPGSTDGFSSKGNSLALQVPLPPLCTGYLSKRGAKLKLWSPRFFVIYQSVPQMFYYEDFEDWKRSQKPAGCVDLANFHGLTIEETGRRSIMEIKTDTKIHRLMAEDRQEALRWKDCIEQVVG